MRLITSNNICGGNLSNTMADQQRPCQLVLLNKTRLSIKFPSKYGRPLFCCINIVSNCPWDMGKKKIMALKFFENLRKEEHFFSGSSLWVCYVHVLSSSHQQHLVFVMASFIWALLQQWFQKSLATGNVSNPTIAW